MLSISNNKENIAEKAIFYLKTLPSYFFTMIV